MWLTGAEYSGVRYSCRGLGVRAWMRVRIVCFPGTLLGEGPWSWLGEASRFGFRCGRVEGVGNVGLVLGVWLVVERVVVGLEGRAVRRSVVLIIALFVVCYWTSCRMVVDGRCADTVPT